MNKYATIGTFIAILIGYAQIENLNLVKFDLYDDLYQNNMSTVDPAAAAASLAGSAHSFLDARMMGKPRTWEGDKRDWPHWQLAVSGYVGALSPELLAMMKLATALKKPVLWDTYHLSEKQRGLDAALFYILTNITAGKAADVLLNVPEGHGLEAWRRYTKSCEARGATHHRPRLMRLLLAKFVSGNFAQRTDIWEKQRRDHERLSKKEVDDELALGVLQQRLAPSGMKEWLALNGSKYEKYEDMKMAIEEYIEHFDVMDEIVEAEEDDPMEIGAIYKGGKGKGDKKGKHNPHKGAGKGGKKGKGKGGKKGKGKGKGKAKNGPKGDGGAFGGQPSTSWFDGTQAARLLRLPED